MCVRCLCLCVFTQCDRTEQISAQSVAAAALVEPESDPSVFQRNYSSHLEPRHKPGSKRRDKTKRGQILYKIRTKRIGTIMS